MAWIRVAQLLIPTPVELAQGMQCGMWTIRFYRYNTVPILVLYRCCDNPVLVLFWFNISYTQIPHRSNINPLHKYSAGPVQILRHCSRFGEVCALTLTLPGPSAGMSGSLDSYCSLKPLCSGMGEVVPARTSPTLLPQSPRTVLSLSCFKVSQCINCRDWHFKS